MLFALLLAQDAAKGANQEAPWWSMLVLPGMFILFFYLVVFKPQQAQRRQQQALMAALKKNDRVLTAGGVIGVVTNLKDDEVQLKIDENSNVKMRVTRSSIVRVLNVSGGGGAEEGDKDKDSDKGKDE